LPDKPNFWARLAPVPPRGRAILTSRDRIWRRRGSFWPYRASIPSPRDSIPRHRDSFRRPGESIRPPGDPFPRHRGAIWWRRDTIPPSRDSIAASRGGFSRGKCALVRAPTRLNHVIDDPCTHLRSEAAQRSSRRRSNLRRAAIRPPLVRWAGRSDLRNQCAKFRSRKSPPRL